MKRLIIALALVCLVALPMAAQTTNSWEIIRADYGWGNNWVDVTERVQSLVRGNSLNFRVDGAALGAEARRGRNRTLRLQLRNNNGQNRQVTYRDNQQVNLQIYGGYQTSLHINRAVYASGNRSFDVTSRLNSLIQDGQLNVVVNNQNMGGDPAVGKDKTLTVHYSLNGQNQQEVVREGGTLRLYGAAISNNQGLLRINRAIYGSGYRTNDVTSRLNSQIQGDQLNVQVNNSTMGGDPAVGQDKTLTVDYSFNGQNQQAVVREGDMLRLAYNVSNNQGALRINRAIYGSGYRTNDVTSRLNSQIQGDQLNLQVNSSTMGGDPAVGQSKTLTVDYTLNGQNQQAVVRDGDMLRLAYNVSNSQGTLRINRAIYGSGYRTNDVTSRLNSQIRDDQLNLQVNSSTMGGDPAVGQDKSLTVDYSLNGQNQQAVVRDGDMLQLPYGATSGLSQRIRCESLQSDGYGRKYCAADTRRGVRLARQIGESACTQGSTWGYDNNGVWVDNGCRGDFEMRGNSRYTGAITTIPSGTEVSVRTNEKIDSNSASVGQQFSAVIAADVLDSSGRVSIPKGSDAGLVIRGSNTSGSDLVLDVDSIMVSGTRYQVSTDDMERGSEGVGANKKTAIFVGGGAAVGTLIGAILGGGKGAAIGAAVGAGAGIGAEVLTKGSQVKVPAETLLRFRLDQDLRLQPVGYGSRTSSGSPSND